MLNIVMLLYNDGVDEPYIKFTIAPDNRMIRGLSPSVTFQIILTDTLRDLYSEIMVSVLLILSSILFMLNHIG